jgi:hypothetical protein
MHLWNTDEDGKKTLMDEFCQLVKNYKLLTGLKKILKYQPKRKGSYL